MGIAARCRVSVVLFMFVMGMLLKPTVIQVKVKTGKSVKVTVMKPQFKAFMDNIIILSKGADDAKSVLKRLDESIK